MKKTSRIVIALLLLFFTFNVNSQTHVITLNVDTANLTRSNASSETISYFTAPTAQVDVASPPEDFEITVEDGATIVWEGVSTSSNGDTVDIFMIKRQRGPRIFNDDDIPRDQNNRVKAKVNGNTPGEAFKYKILFKVNGAGRMYKIDPKIKIGPGN